MMIFLAFILLSILISTESAVRTSKKALVRESRAASGLSAKGTEKYAISVITWNFAEKCPSKKDCTFLKNYRNDDIVVLGVQECEDVRPRRQEGHRSRAWKALQSAALGKNFTCIAQHRMGGLQLAVYVKKRVANRIKGTQILDVACGVGNVLTNKGAICVLLRIQGKTLAFINAHLAAHVGKVIKSTDNFDCFISMKSCFESDLNSITNESIQQLSDLIERAFFMLL
jgi:inositol polyphosphate 5-phosphatase INPP5J/K